jgi:hypothetical protein
MCTLLLILGYVSIVISAMSEAAMDTLQFHYDKSIFNQAKYNQTFWNPIISWKNKWKDDTYKTEKFMGSTTIFVFVTDAWHLLKFIKNSFIFIGLPLIAISLDNIILGIIIARVIYGLSFTLAFDKILIKS